MSGRIAAAAEGDIPKHSNKIVDEVQVSKMKKKDSEDALDDLREASKAAYSKQASKSIVDRLVEADWCEAEDLLLAYEDLQKPDLDRVTVFFKTPIYCSLARNLDKSSIRIW
jgi:hypothetical protein